MRAIISSFSTFLKNNPWANTVISFLFGGLFGNVLSNWLYREFGYLIAIVSIIVILSVVLLIMFITLWYVLKKRERLEAKPTSEPLHERYKGLIVSISRLNETKYQVISKVDSVKDLEDAEGLNELYKVRGVGQTFRAIKHHLGRLEVCWLLCTGDVNEGKELVEYFIRKFGSRTVKVKSVPLESPNEIGSVHKAINDVYVNKIKEYNLEEKEVIADVTGGTTIMSSAMTLACISPDRDIEYVEQKTYKLIKIDENISEVIFRN
jgi:hypothetical protein